MKDKFNEIGKYLIQIGLYLSTIDVEKFEERQNIKENTINFLMQSYLYLQSYNQLSISEGDNDEDSYEDKDMILSRKQVIEMYYPLFTEYGLTQSIHIKGLPYFKRGSKYFFKKSEIDKWLDDNSRKGVNKSIKFV